MEDPTSPPSDTEATPTCAQCDRALGVDDRVVAGDRTFCRSCYEVLLQELRQGITAMTSDINYPMAAIGAVLGGAVGVIAWWGATVLTHLAFGLLAIAIGWLVAQGAVRLAGNKRSAGLQALAVAVSVVSFTVASYLVNMTFVNQELVRRGVEQRIPFPPPGIDVFFRVVSLGFGIMDVVFVALMIWQAWSIPRPPRLPERAPA